MFKVSRFYNRFQIKLEGDRKKYFANDLLEVDEAMFHYFGGRSANEHKPEACPLCKAVKKEKKTNG